MELIRKIIQSVKDEFYIREMEAKQNTPPEREGIPKVGDTIETTFDLPPFFLADDNLDHNMVTEFMGGILKNNYIKLHKYFFWLEKIHGVGPECMPEYVLTTLRRVKLPYKLPESLMIKCGTKHPKYSSLMPLHP